MSENPKTEITQEELEKFLLESGFSDGEFDSQIPNQPGENKFVKGVYPIVPDTESTKEGSSGLLTQEEIDALMND